jgi:Ca2+-binding RTX toxin-like protein
LALLVVLLTACAVAPASADAAPGGSVRLTMGTSDRILTWQAPTNASSLTVTVDAQERFVFTSSGDLTVDDTSVARGCERLTSQAVACPSRPFSAPVNHVILNGGAASDTIDLGSSMSGASFSPAISPDIQVTGAGSEDVLRTDASLQATLDGGPGNDQVVGGPAVDTLIGGPGDDTIDAMGDSVVDFINPGTEAEVIGDTATFTRSSGAVEVTLGDALADGPIGATGNEILDSSFRNVQGTSGADVLVGDAQANRLSGMGGADRIEGRAGADVLSGSSGNDVIRPGVDGAVDTIDAGADVDLVDYSDATSAVIATLSDGSVDGPDGELLGSSIEGLRGGVFGDSLTGDSQDNYLEGGDGNDILSGVTGQDTYVGGTGNDTVFGSTDAAIDTYELGGPDGEFDTLSYAHLPAAVSIDLADLAAVDLERVVGTSFNDHLEGTSGSERLSGGDGADYLWGGGSVDELFGGAGDDTIDPSDDGVADTLDAGDTGETNGDTVEYGTTHAISVTLGDDLPDGVLNGIGNEVIDASFRNVNGSSHDDVLVGDMQANLLSGGAGNDDVRGMGGADRLYGHQGNDNLDAQDGEPDLVVDCGDGALDSAFADSGDQVAATCESLTSNDSDLDDDGIWNLVDCAPSNAAAPAQPGPDTDCDGIRDGLEDNDGDGLANESDCAPADATRPLRSSADTNCNGVADAGEDFDGDGITNASDCSPSAASRPAQPGPDANCNGTRDGLDDGDGDGLANESDCAPGDAARPARIGPDADCNGATDVAAASTGGTTGGTTTCTGDADCDGIPDLLEPVVRVGSAAANILIGRDGADRLIGAGGNDTLRGKGGNDLLDGGPGRDVIEGANGNDFIRCGTGNDDRVIAGAGNDTANCFDVRATRRTRDIIDCGTGRDTVTIDRYDVVRNCERVIRR